MINITDERARRLWQREMDRQMEFLQSPYARSLTALLKRQFGAAADFVRQGMLDAIGIAVDRMAKDQSELLMAHYRKVATAFGKKAFGIMDGMKLVSVPEMKSPMDEFWVSINLWTSTQAATKIRNIQTTTKDSIAAIVQSGMREQLSHRDIAKKIEKTSNQINPYRARTIALTETHTAAVKSVDAAVKSTRIEMEKEWVSSKDARTRTRDQGSPFEHFATFPAGADGERIPQDDKFIGTGEPMDFPGDPKGSAGNVIRCRCVALYFPVRVMEPTKPYEPEEILGDLDIGSAVDSPDDILKYYEESGKATYTEGLDASQMKAAIADRLGGRAWAVRSKEMDELMNFYLNPSEKLRAEGGIYLKQYMQGTSNIIRQWAMTSGDENPSSIMMQLAAKEEFKLKGASVWWREAELNQAKDLLKTHGKSARQFLRLMYEDTQEHLRKQGLKTVRLVRGYTGKVDLGSTLSKPLVKTRVKLQPLSSFSSDVEVSMEFTGGAGAGESRVLIFSEVPIERVLSTPVTGFGCMRESEYVVLGNQKRIGEKVLGAGTKRQIGWQDLFEPRGKTWNRVISESIFEETKKGIVKPMTAIGNLSKCIIGQKDFVDYDIKERPLSCNDYVREGKKWLHKGKEIDDEIILQRLNKMKLPPSWVNVTASRDLSSKIQAIGQDKTGRWQYRYLAEHVGQASVNKFNRVKSFSQDVGGIRRDIEKGMKAGDSRAFLLEIENRTAMRIGTDRDLLAKQKAYGLTTLQNEHVQITGNRIVFDFIAKEGISARYELEDKILADWIGARKARTKAGEKLFPDVSGKKLNEYLKRLSGKEYTVRDFRTYHATRIAHDELRPYAGKALTGKEKGGIVRMVSEKVARFLHNTPTTAKNSYINPLVWDFIGGL